MWLNLLNTLTVKCILFLGCDDELPKTQNISRLKDTRRRLLIARAYFWRKLVSYDGWQRTVEEQISAASHGARWSGFVGSRGPVVCGPHHQRRKHGGLEPMGREWWLLVECQVSTSDDTVTQISSSESVHGTALRAVLTGLYKVDCRKTGSTRCRR